MLLKINVDNPEGRKVSQVAEQLAAGGIIIYPTDTVYGLGCDINNSQAVERICRLRGLEPEKAMLSFICKDISQIAEYTMPIENNVFRLMKKNLPGPFTFVLRSNNQVPKMFKNRKRTIGVRVPDHHIPVAIVEALGRPILTTSLKSDDEVLEYFTDPEDIYQDFQKLVDIVIDGGVCGNNPSTIVDCTGDLPEVIRKGAGDLMP
ncbi:MAG TPA: L-threonylcarbamoyladenylate synthase [Saprospiraceae bacterium]|nr:L-threonylcarbamoyladenylate synthase [Saprospiraceae bacterium]HMP23394.1 L-threonylcarbamoyladenylate synthase [Saprospiraceae bacterium]